MKKLLTLFLSVILMLSLTACSGETSGKGPEPTERVQLANPYVTCQDQQEMEQETGFSVSLPAAAPEWAAETIYRAMPGKLAEIIYTDGDNEIRVRVAYGSEDISGVYNTDCTLQKDVTAGDYTVHLKSEAAADNTVASFVGTWTYEGRTYSVTSRNGVPETELLAVIAEVR